jgi:hypothetical protein
MSALAGSLTLPGNHGGRDRQDEVVIAGAEVVDLKRGNRVRSPPHDEAHLPPAGRLSRCIGDDARTFVRARGIEVDTWAAAFASRNNIEVGNSGTHDRINGGDRCATQSHLNDLGLALTYTTALRNHGVSKEQNVLNARSLYAYMPPLGCSGVSGS